MQFTQVDVAWSTSTFILYLVIIISCYFITVAGKNVVLVYGNTKDSRKKLWAILVSVILVFVKGFGTTGRDLRGGYYVNFLSATSMKQFGDKSIEIGFRILTVLVRKFTDEYWILIFICTLITIVPVMHMLKKYANQIDLPIAVLLYVTCFFITGFSPLRQAMSASLALYGFDAMIEHKYGKAVFWILLASSFHVASIIFIVPLLSIMAKLADRDLIIVGMLGLFILVWIERQSIISLFFSEDSRYAIYGAFATVNLGFEKIVYYIPLFLTFTLGKKIDDNKDFERVSFVYLCMGFFFGMASYLIEIFGRFDISFMPLIIIIPYYCLRVKKRFPKYRILFNLAVIIYCIARFVIFIVNYHNSQGLMPYTNVFGWTI